MLLTPAREGLDRLSYAVVVVDLADVEAGALPTSAAESLPLREGTTRKRPHLALGMTPVTARNAASAESLTNVLDGLLDALLALTTEPPTTVPRLRR
jgi:hypothetical protein